MAFGGFFDGVGEGGSFLPIIKYDSRSGRISRRDRENNENTDVDITKSFKAIFDFENVEIGWINFNTGSAPDFRVARFADGVNIEKPAGEGYKRGVRFVIKLSKECGGDVREFASNAAAFLDGAKSLMDAYEAGVKENPGKLPVVELKDSIAKTSTGGQMKTTNYVPVWQITNWVKRPEGFVFVPRSASSTSSQEDGASTSGPATTGSTKVAPPAGGDDDFG
jgi:hypothetical protein